MRSVRPSGSRLAAAASRAPLMTGLLWDVRYAARAVAGVPGFALTAILTLALGIGANVAMFSIAYGVLVRPLAYDDADHLVVVRAEVDYVGAHRPVPVSIRSGTLATWQQPFDGVASIAFYTAADVVALSGEDGAEVLNSAVVSSAFFSTLAGPIAAGRPLAATDDPLPLSVISHRLAQRLFGGPDRAIGGQLRLTGRIYTVVGVADRAFRFPSADIDVWLPAGFVRAVNPRCCDFRVIARLDEHGTVERARAALAPMFQASADGSGRRNDGIRTSVSRLSDDMVAAARPAVLVLFASVLMVMAIACGNLVNLVLARNASRGQEFAVRRALGASAGRLLRQLLLESAVLGLAGAIGGVALAHVSLAAVARFAGDAVPRLDAIHIDLPALLFAAALGILATILTGIAPALRVAGGAAIPSQRSAAAATPPGARRLQRAMCVVQVALAVMLLVGATLLGRSLVRLLNVDLGVTTGHVLIASMNLAFGERPDDAQVIARVDRIVEHMQALPGVQAAGVGTSVPPSVSRIRVTLRRTGDVVDYQAAAVPATPGYFAALQMRLVKGRFFTDADDDRRPPVMIMSEGTARRFFGSDDPIGRTISLPVLRNGVRGSADVTLVGVTANVKYAGLAAPPDDVVYRPFAQQPWVAPFLIVRTTGNPADFAQTLRRAVAAVDKDVVVSSVTPLQELVRDATAPAQFRTFLLASFATLALAIATVGVYGVVAYAVSRRTKELGIRMALGATSSDVLTMVLGEGLVVALAGILAGTAASWMLARLVTGMLYGITPTDPASFLVASAALLVVTLAATYIPARRAARIDPIGSLRME